MRHKKGSLNISVEAIIILIFAITMLGLGLGFIRGMFTNVTTQLEGQVSNEPEPSTPSAANQITLSRESIIASPGQQQVLKIGIYNTGLAEPAAPFLSCSGFEPISGEDTDPDPLLGDDDILPTESVNMKTIQPNEKDTFVVIFDIPIGKSTGQYLCEAGFPYVEPRYYKDFTIKII